MGCLLDNGNLPFFIFFIYLFIHHSYLYLFDGMPSRQRLYAFFDPTGALAVMMCQARIYEESFFLFSLIPAPKPKGHKTLSKCN